MEKCIENGETLAKTKWGNILIILCVEKMGRNAYKEKNGEMYKQETIV